MFSQSSLSSRVILDNRTNVSITPSNFFIPAPFDKRLSKRKLQNDVSTIRKRLKPSMDKKKQSNVESEPESEDKRPVQESILNSSVFRRSVRTCMKPVAFHTPGYGPTDAVLRSFVSSNKSGIFKCHSSDVNSYFTPLYACSFTHGAKRGGTPILAVATEQGSVHVIDTTKRQGFDTEISRNVFQPHNNGIFDLKWNSDDTLLATSSGDQLTCVSCATTQRTTHVLRGHASTVKCVAWDPSHRDLLSTGGRDGTICIWDLRTASRVVNAGNIDLIPVMEVPNAHGKPKGQRVKNVLPSPSVTQLLYSDKNPPGLISGGSFDGILKYWDLRLLRRRNQTSSAKLKPLSELYSPSFDPTLLYSQRPRGIVRLASGVGPTSGMIFATGSDSRIHVYSLPSLEPQRANYTHENMQTNSFFVGMALSLCGRWIASGGTGNAGRLFLFDVADTARPWRGYSSHTAVELRGHEGEICGIDWAEGMLASCADDGTVRIWRPDIGVYRSCEENLDEQQTEWIWSGSFHT